MSVVLVLAKQTVGAGVQDQTKLHCKLLASLSYMKIHFKNLMKFVC